SSASSSPYATEGQSVIVQPDGGTVTTATITLNVPAGVPLTANPTNGESPLTFTISVGPWSNQVRAMPGKPVQVAPGVVCVRLSTVRVQEDVTIPPSSTYDQSLNDCTLNVKAGQTVQYSLSGLRVTYDDALIAEPEGGSLPWVGIYRIDEYQTREEAFD